MSNYQLSLPKKVGGQAILNLRFRIYFIAVFCVFAGCSALFAQNAGYQRIISLGPAITRQISLLEAEDKVIGVTAYCQIKDKEIVGTITNTNIEKTLLLKPDMVLATRLTNIKTIQRLKKLGINVAVFDEVKSFSQLCKDFLRLARIVGKEKLGNKIISDANEKVFELSLKNRDLPKKKVIVQIGASPLWVAAKNSLISEFIKLAGGINAGPAGENGLVGREYVVRQNPDVIIIIEMGMLAEEETEKWMKLDTINAVKQKKIYIFDSYDICSPTPLSFVKTLEELSEIFHSETE